MDGAELGTEPAVAASSEPAVAASSEPEEQADQAARALYVLLRPLGTLMKPFLGF